MLHPQKKEPTNVRRSGKEITGPSYNRGCHPEARRSTSGGTEDPSLKKLPGKKTPPTLVLKRGRNQSMETPMPPPVPEPKIPKK
jgi:hypothetical protein